MNEKHFTKLLAKVPASSLSRNAGDNKRQERKDAMPNQEDGKLREDAREGNLEHIDNRDVDWRAIDDFSRYNTKAHTKAGMPPPTVMNSFYILCCGTPLDSRGAHRNGNVHPNCDY